MAPEEESSLRIKSNLQDDSKSVIEKERKDETIVQAARLLARLPLPTMQAGL